jgi:hypothetical protein
MQIGEKGIENLFINMVLEKTQIWKDTFPSLLENSLKMF